MRRVRIVVGLGFGDEGKGKVTDALCNEERFTVVVRFSGGHNAAHNVVNDGKQHIHASFPSGTLRGFPGYLSEHCVVSPVHLVHEAQVLQNKGITPKLTTHPHAIVCTPLDFIEGRAQALETEHGSCGVGLGATMKRHLMTPYKLFVSDLFNKDIFEWKLDNIAGSYANSPMLKWWDASWADEYREFRDYVEEFKDLVDLSDYRYLSYYQNIVFEGSQGILLDQDHGFFPHVTYAHTTSRNAIKICNKLGIPGDDIDVVYVTRSYLTRHGNGPLPGETDIPLKNTEAEINVENEFQGPLRFAPLNINLMQHSLRADQGYWKKGMRSNLVMNCMDQVENPDYVKVSLPGPHIPSGGLLSSRRFWSYTADSRELSDTLFGRKPTFSK